ncbi:hypothetical protein HFO84_35615 [Rhizobium leguminosarum]|uniref:hypothetical protein n=1 Tax=Rhizobium leguminosarum TaxID=384 RepID=UPI001C95CF0C|nr:hypothetical protein [Rhizobium leguminosarum]MBY5482601.1 hypothetical protein [Rhizobium leguminosarum]
MNAYNIENADGGLALVSAANSGHFEWIEAEAVAIASKSVVCVRLTLCDIADSNLFAHNVEGAADLRLDMDKWLDGYSVTIPCDFADKASFASASAEAARLYARFARGDFAPLPAAA